MQCNKDNHWKRGYVSGSFDLFHIGHLNLIRRAKECCDYLIVGVLEDELVARKGKWPVIPLANRLEIVKSLKYVDEVDTNTEALLNKITAWEKYRFDAMFSGDDHKSDGWGWEEPELNKRGAVLVFFPYTKEVSTTNLHEQVLPPKAVDAVKPSKISEFTHLFPFDKVNKGERLIIYGMDDVGEQYASQLNALDFCKVIAFTDSYNESRGTFNGFPTVPVSDVAGNLDAFDRIVIASEKYYNQIIMRLRSMMIAPERIV